MVVSTNFVPLDKVRDGLGKCGIMANRCCIIIGIQTELFMSGNSCRPCPRGFHFTDSCMT